MPAGLFRIRKQAVQRMDLLTLLECPHTRAGIQGPVNSRHCFLIKLSLTKAGQNNSDAFHGVDPLAYDFQPSLYGKPFFAFVARNLICSILQRPCVR